MTRRCSTCAVNYPTTEQKCPVCDDPTSFFSDLSPHEDWEARVKSALWSPSMHALVQVAENRLARFREAGLDIGTAMIYAADHGVDLHLFERLREQGCSVDAAARIIAPLR